MKQERKIGSTFVENSQVFTKNGLWLYVWMLLFFIITFKLHISGDTVALIHGLDSALQCFNTNPIRWPCGPQVVHFPVFQYLVALPFRLLGFKDETLLPLLAFLSIGWFLVSIATFWRVGILAAGIRGGHLALMVLFSGYITWYATSSFNEAASFALFALLALSVLDQWKVFWIAIIAFLCAITKEIAFPFVFSTVAIASLTKDQSLPNFQSLYLWIRKFISKYFIVVAAIIFGFIVNIVFNLFRFGSIQNISNLNPLLITPWIYAPEFFFYLWFSPASGLFFVWGTLCLLAIAGFYFCRHDSVRLWQLGLIIGTVVLINIGLAKWYSPFGWNAWGPRLTLPFLGGMGVILIFLAGANIVKILASVKSKIIFVALGISIFTLTMPNIAIRLDEGQMFGKMFSPTILQKAFGYDNFITVQTVPSDLYMKSSIEFYSRNSIIPITAKIASENISILMLWFMFFMSILAKIFHDKPTAHDVD